MKSLNQEGLENYILGYSGNDQNISFVWNGEHGEKFSDHNWAFRNDVIDHVLQSPDSAPLSLLVDLYRAITSSSKESWSIDMRIKTITEMMLSKGRETVAKDYLIGAMQSFDAYLSTAAIDCSVDILKDCLELANENLRAEEHEEERKIWELGVERFSEFVKNV